MRSAYDFARYFIKNGFDANTLDGNMKLQKLLTFANLIHLTKTGQTLFEEPMQAYNNGCVVEPVRYRYYNNYDGFARESHDFNPDFNQAEYETLEETIALFGALSSRELSSIQHEFRFWKEANAQSDQRIALAAIIPELDRIRDVLHAKAESSTSCMKSEKINDVTFFYDPTFRLTDKIIEQLYNFSWNADEPAYTIYEEDGELVVY